MSLTDTQESITANQEKTEGLDSSSIRINKMEGDHETAPFHSSTQKGPKIKRLRDISVTK